MVKNYFLPSSAKKKGMADLEGIYLTGIFNKEMGIRLNCHLLQQCMAADVQPPSGLTFWGDTFSTRRFMPLA
jgi:hypothetical protein